MAVSGSTAEAGQLLCPWTSGTPFEGEELSVASLYLNSGVEIPALSPDAYRAIASIQCKPGEGAQSRFRFIDLFAGIGGFRQALSGLGGRCVFTSEWDETAKRTYFANYGEFPFGDINKLTSVDVTDDELASCIPDHEVLAAGFPCQPFSRAGVSARTALGQAHGFLCETQGTLFYSVERIARVKQPMVLFLENVRNIVTHDQKRTFETIRRHLERAGYDFHYSVIDSSTVVPQRRVRCYMVAVRKDVAQRLGQFDFPAFEGAKLPLGPALEDNPDPRFQISERLWQGHIQRTNRNIARGAGFSAFLADLNRPSNTIVARYGKDGKECLVPVEGGPPRTLTFTELKRLFGYPPEFVPAPTKTAAYRQFGNSVVVPVIRRIAEKFLQQYITPAEWCDARDAKAA